jgi:hypothetical protein
MVRRVPFLMRTDEGLFGILVQDGEANEQSAPGKLKAGGK